MRFFERYHPAALLAYFAAVLLIAMFAGSPLTVALALAGGLCFAATMTTAKEKLADLTFYLPLVLLVTITNPLFSHNGVTPLFFLNGRAVTLEAILYGAGLGVTLWAVLLWCRCWSRIMTSEKLLYLFGRAIPKLSLVLSMALRYVPLLRRQAKKLERAQQVLGLYASERYFDRLRSKLAVYSGLVGWSLENAVEVSRSMKARGYGLKGRTAYANYHFTRCDAALLAFSLCAAGLYLTVGALGYGGFTYYPALSGIDTRLPALAGEAAFAALAFAPFLIEGRQTLQWNFCKSKI